jgi:SAM-dependent methyltransferase
MRENLRAKPRIWDPGWLVLRRMAQAIHAILGHPSLSLRGASVLDFGCGTRPYEPWFTAAGARYQGADIDRRHEVAIAEDGSLGAADATFDMVASFQVLEHVWDVGAYLAESRRVLKAQGCLLLSTHGQWFYHPHPADYRRWTGEGLRREVEAQGFQLLEMRAIVGPLAWSTILRSFGFAHAFGRLPVAGPAVAGLAAALCNLRAWLEDRVTPATIRAQNACVYVALFRRAS